MLHQAYHQQNFTQFTKILDQIHPDQELDCGKRTILMRICWGFNKGDDKYVKLLLEKGANPNYNAVGTNCDILGDVILRLSTDFPTQNEILRLLIKYGADVNAKPDYLHFAVNNIHYNPEVVKILLQNGINQNHKRKEFTPLMTIKKTAKEYRYANNPRIIKIIEMLENGWQYVDKREQEIERLKQQEIERLKQQEIERLKQQEIERLKQQEIERLKQQEIERLKQQEIERLKQQEIERSKQQEIERLKQQEIERLKQQEIERLKQQEIERSKQQEAKQTIENKYNKAEAGSYLTLALYNLEYLSKMEEHVPEDLKKFMKAYTSQLLIKTGQTMPPEILVKMDIPDEYKNLINYKDTIQPMWKN